MKFEEAIATGIENPSLNAYLAQIKDLQTKIANADPKTRIELNKQLQVLRQQMNAKKQEQMKALKIKQQELAKANTAV